MDVEYGAAEVNNHGCSEGGYGADWYDRRSCDNP